jgi:hypothetical protein
VDADIEFDGELGSSGGNETSLAVMADMMPKRWMVRVRLGGECIDERSEELVWKAKTDN